MNKADQKAWDANAANMMEQFRTDAGKVIDKGKIDPDAKGSTYTPSPKRRAKRRTGAQFAR